MDRSNDWLDEAEGDLEHATDDLKGGFYNWACFSAQQGSEKAIQAVFQRMGEEARRLIRYAEKIFEICSDLLSKIQ